MDIFKICLEWGQRTKHGAKEQLVAPDPLLIVPVILASHLLSGLQSLSGYLGMVTSYSVEGQWPNMTGRQRAAQSRVLALESSL